MKKLLYLSFMLFSAQCFANPLLEAPKELSNKDIKTITKQHNTEMNFSTKLWNIRFLYNNNKTQYLFSFSDEFLSFLTPEERKKCKCITSQTHPEQQVCHFKYNTTQTWDFPLGQENDNDYFFAKPLEFENAQLTELIDEEHLLCILQQSKAVFYTGAGISAPVVPTMSVLLKEAQLAPETMGKKAILKPLQSAIKNPKQYRLFMDYFYEAMLYGEPTEAHHAIKNIASLLKCQIFTENLDLLHQRTHIQVLGPLIPSQFFKQYTNADLKDIEVIVCVGLSHDDRGFLAYLKSINPQLRIVAIDLKQPNYLSDKDYWLKADIQKILPDIEYRLSIDLPAVVAT